MTETPTATFDLLELTADIVAAQVSNNTVAVSDLPALIASVHRSLASLGQVVEPVEEALSPAVAIRSSIKPDYIVCLEDGKKLKMLKRHLMTHYKLTPDQYRAKWKLASDYPMVAPNYAQQRSSLALKIGLGRKAAVPLVAAPVAPAPEPASEPVVAKKPRAPRATAPVVAPVAEPVVTKKPRAPRAAASVAAPAPEPVAVKKPRAPRAVSPAVEPTPEPVATRKPRASRKAPSAD